MKKLLWALLFIMLSNVLFAQLKDDLKNEILVYIQKTDLKLPEELKVNVPLRKVEFISKELQNVFQSYGVSSISKAFPDWKETDTLKILKDGSTIKNPNFSRIFSIRVIDEKQINSAISELKNIKGAIFAEKNMDVYLNDDPDYDEQWHLNNTGQSGGASGIDINAEAAWQIYTGSSNIKIGIIDSGVETDHEDLSGKSSGDQPSENFSNKYHGTHVAGLAAAKANNDKGGRGVDWNARILSKRIFDNDGYVGDSQAASKIISAVNDGAHILNNSWSGGEYSSTIAMAFAYVYKHNRVSTAAMGNYYESGNPTRYPAALGNIIAVGAIDDDGDRSPYSQIGNHIDVCAPGGEYAGSSDALFSTWGNNTYENKSGTSMATPLVSGLASLLKGYNNNLFNDDIEHIMEISATDENNDGFDEYFGHGRINAEKGLNYLRSPYTLLHKSQTSGSEHSHTNAYTAYFLGVSGLADGVYIVKRYEVRKTVNFGQTFQGTPYVWGRGVGSTGLSDANPNYGMGYTGVVSNNSSSATLKTYVYKVWTIAEQYLGWCPVEASDVEFAYTILGKSEPLSVSISGPTYLFGHQYDKGTKAPAYHATGTWTANVSGGSSSRNYQWYEMWSTGWHALPNETSSSLTHTIYSDEDFKCVVTSGSETMSATIHVDLINPIKKKSSIPEKITLKSNFPNPFNPTTNIKFGLPNAQKVEIYVYSITGEKIRTLVNNTMEAGYHTINWNATYDNGAKVSSGIYIYQMKCGNKVYFKKMIFAK